MEGLKIPVTIRNKPLLFVLFCSFFSLDTIKTSSLLVIGLDKAFSILLSSRRIA